MSALDLCPECGYSVRWTWHLAHCILNGVTLSDEDLRILAQAALDTADAENRLRDRLREKTHV